MTWIRLRLSRLVCFFLGHAYVDRNAVWKMMRDWLDKDVEAYCIRCGHRNSFMADLAENVFAEGPIFKAMKERQ